MSSASTSASRAKAVERLGTEKHSSSKDSKEAGPKKLPELGGLDFAERRKRIQQAFTKSVAEQERKEAIKAERRRAAKQKEEEEKRDQEQRKAEEVAEAHGKEAPEEPTKNYPAKEESKEVLAQESSSRSSEEIPPDERHLTLDTINIPTSFGHIDLTKGSTFDHDDSPTLGIPGNFPDSRLTVNRSQTPGSEIALLSAVTAGTAETEDTIIDNEPQTDRPEPTFGHRTVLSQVMRMRASSPTSPSRSEAADDSLSDRDDQESIQIMLRATPVVENASELIDDESQDEDLKEVFSNQGPGDRWSTNSWDSSDPDQRTPDRIREAPMERIDEYSPPQPEDSARSSFSTAAGSQQPQPYSPTDSSTPRTARSTLDSETYSTINRILEQYHDPSLLSPQMMHDFQQQLLIQSPELARQGGWDTKRVTQLYLRELARRRLTSTSAVPGPLNLGSHGRLQQRETSAAPRSETQSPVADNVESENDTDADTDHGYELSESGWSSHRPSLDVDSSELKPQRASLSHPDDWAHTSPSILDWIHPPAPSPTDERHELEYRPTPPSKEGRPTSPRADVADKGHQYKEAEIMSRTDCETPRLYADDRPRLHEIDSTDGCLGLAIHVDSPQDNDSQIFTKPPPLPNYSPPLPPSVPPISEILIETQSPPSPSIYHSHPPSSIGPNVFPQGFDAGPSTRSSGDSSFQRGFATPSAQTSGSSSRSQEQIGLDVASSVPTSEQKRLNKRKHVIQELVDTENSYCQDMKVVEDIYKCTASSCASLSSDDIKILFSNADQVVEFSTVFLKALKQAARSVYIPQRSARWQNKRGSGATSNSGQTDDQHSLHDSDLTDEEKDRNTFIGDAFNQHMVSMEKIYSEYLKNHDAANKRLEVLVKDRIAATWMTECHKWANDLTKAWDLDSLLVKPVQRILKYPLLLKQLLEATPENHPDFAALDIAVREMMGASHRINEMKKRVDLVEQAVNRRKRKETDVRNGLYKAFGRRTEKLRQQVGLSELYDDKEYNMLSERFTERFVQLQVVMRDIEAYTVEVQLYMDRFNGIIAAFENFLEVGPTTHPELESKWRKFRMSMREMAATALTEHVSEDERNLFEFS